MTRRRRWWWWSAVADERCPVCDCSPLVLIAIAHPAMRRMIFELLDREHGCWTACVPDGALDAAAVALGPDLVIVDGGCDFPRACREQLPGYPTARIVVIGPEPDKAYRAAAVRYGAGGWIARDDIADQLSTTMRIALGCHHQPCPSPNLARPARPSHGGEDADTLADPVPRRDASSITRSVDGNTDSVLAADARTVSRDDY